MDAQKLEKFVNVLQVLVKFNQEQNIIDKCLNKSVEQNDVQVYIGPTMLVNIN